MKIPRTELKSTGTQCLETDTFPMFSDILNKGIKICAISFKTGEDLDMDEQLFSSKFKFKLIQNMPNKPDRFGINFWMLVDVGLKFICNVFLYLGKAK